MSEGDDEAEDKQGAGDGMQPQLPVADGPDDDASSDDVEAQAPGPQAAGGGGDKPEQSGGAPSLASPRLVAASDIASLPETATLIVVHVGGPSRPGSPAIMFQRASVASDFDAPGDVWFRASTPARFIGRPSRIREATLVFEVPPGHWRMIGMSNGRYTASFCLGAPSFEVGEGEVVYAGAYYTGVRDRGPDLRLERGLAALAAAPSLAQRLRTATYSNGDVSRCAGTYLFAYEVEGAPFREGYRWGSRAQLAFALTEAADQPVSP